MNWTLLISSVFSIRFSLILTCLAFPCLIWCWCITSLLLVLILSLRTLLAVEVVAVTVVSWLKPILLSLSPSIVPRLLEIELFGEISFPRLVGSFEFWAYLEYAPVLHFDQGLIIAILMFNTFKRLHWSDFSGFSRFQFSIDDKITCVRQRNLTYEIKIKIDKRSHFA